MCCSASSTQQLYDNSPQYERQQRSAACTAHIVAKLNFPPNESAPKGAVGFPLVCTNGARGLRVLNKTYSDVGGVSSSSSVRHHEAHYRSNTVPLSATSSSTTTATANDTPKNPFLNNTLIIDEELFHTPLSPSLTLKTLALANRLGCVTNYYQNHHIYAVARTERHFELTRRYGILTGSLELYRYLNEKYNDAGGKDDDDVYNADNSYGYQLAVEKGPPSKLLILCDTEQLDEITNLVRTELNGEASETKTSEPIANVIRGTPPFFVEILDPEVHKGHGLKQLCNSLSIPMEEVIAFGDGDNDKEFLEMSGWGVAMKNARNIVKEIADEVGEWSNDEVGC